MELIVENNLQLKLNVQVALLEVAKLLTRINQAVVLDVMLDFIQSLEAMIVFLVLQVMYASVILHHQLL
jgi:hypothetical protein